MPDNKDFLDQFSDAGKPASFKEEERVPVKKEKKPINTKALAITAGVLLVLAIASYFLFFAPKIEMPNFVGMTKNDVAAWVKQQGIDATGILFNEQYDFDTDDGTILTQSITPGKKVRKDVKINFNLSKGADPDEQISVPDLYTMEKEDIQAWIQSNKLQKTKISTSYNENVDANFVIDYTFTGCEEDTFTRGCSLKINVSKGSAPAGSVTVEDFEKKPYATVESWAKSKKINLNKVEQYSDKIDKDYVISQSVSSGKTIKEGETLTVVVSLGKAVYMENVIGWDIKKFESWALKNGVSYKSNELYTDYAKGIITTQSINQGKLISEDDYLEVTVSLGNVVEFGDWYNRPYHAIKGVDGLHEKKDLENEKGADIDTKKDYKYDDNVPLGYVIYNDREVEVGGTLNVTISRGRNILLKDTDDLKWSELYTYDEYKVRQLLDANDLTYTVDYKPDSDKPSGYIHSISRADGGDLIAGVYCPQDVTITVEISSKISE